MYCTFFLGFGLLFSQEQSTVSPWRTIYLTDLLPTQRDAANFNLATLVGNGNQLYLLLVPKNGKDLHPLLVIVSEDGVTEGVEELPSHVEPLLGVDSRGTATVLAHLPNGPSVLKYSSAGNLVQTRDIAPTRAAVQAYKQYLRKARRTPTNAISASVNPAVEEISNIVPSATDPYIQATLSNGKTAKLHLANSQLTVIDPDKNMSTTTLSIDQNSLRQFGTHLKSGSNVIYPDFLSLAVSPRGGL